MRHLLCRLKGTVLLASLALAVSTVPVRSRNETTKSPDKQQAIAFQQAKDRADARQAAMESRHPTVFYDQAERQAALNQSQPPGKDLVPDTWQDQH